MKSFTALVFISALVARESMAQNQGRVVGGPPPPSVAVPVPNVLAPITNDNNMNNMNKVDKMTNKMDTNVMDDMDAKINALNEISNDIEAENKLVPSPEDLGFVDSVLGHGTQSRIIGSVNNWISNKAKTNPGCIERFVCETYATGETMNGIPYLLMSLTNAAVSFYVAEIFDDSIDIQEITRAARFGRTIGSCHNMKCPVMDGQLRTLGDFLGTLEEFFSSVFTSVSSSISG